MADSGIGARAKNSWEVGTRSAVEPQEKELRPIDQEYTRIFAIIYPVIPAPNEEAPPGSATSDLNGNGSSPSEKLVPGRITRRQSACKLPDAVNFEELLARLGNQDFLDELSAIEQWFRVLSPHERLASLHRFLYHIGFGPLSVYLLSEMLRYWHKIKHFSYFDPKILQTIEKERIRARSCMDFIDELEAITTWFDALDDIEKILSFIALLNQASPSQIAFLCYHKATQIVASI